MPFGPIPSCYLLTELAGAGYRQRNRRNVDDSDATLVVNLGALNGGTRQTALFADHAKKPLLVLSLDTLPVPDTAQTLRDWLAIHQPEVLNVAGPRESKRPGIGLLTRQVLDAVAALVCLQQV